MSEVQSPVRLPRLELEVMKVLWRRGPSRVGAVREDLMPERPLAYTTVMTLLDRLEKKGAVTREKRGRSYVYEPVLSREVVLDHAVDRLVKDFFGDSRERLAAYLRGVRPAPLEMAEESLDSVLL